MTTTLRVFLADDHAVVREGLKALITAQADMEVVGEAADGASAVLGAQQLQADVAVLDISMPQINGIEAARQLKRAAPQIKVLTLTVHEDKSYLQQVLDAGAAGYVLKRAAATDLISAIRAVASGGNYIDPVVAAKLLQKFGSGSLSEGRAHKEDLSDREEEVLRYIAQGFSNKEIASRLDISVKSIETYKARSIEKLGLRSRVDIVRYAVGRGWLQEP